MLCGLVNTAQTMSPHLSSPLPSVALAGAAAAGPQTRRRGAARADGLSAGQQRAVVGAILLLHAGLGYGLLQVQAVRDAVTQAAPIFVDLLTPPAPPAPVPVPPPPLPAQRVMPKKTPPAPVITAAPSPAPAAFTTPPPPPVIEPAEPIAPPAPPVELAVQAPPAPPKPTPKMIPASAVQYLEQVEPTYPPASVRLRESGRPTVRVLIDEGGLPRTVQVYQTSGFVRLDESCVAALKRSRFKPYTENGQPTAGWAVAPCTFEM